MDNFIIKTNYQSTQNSISLKTVKVLLLTDGNHVGCGFYQLGLTLNKLLCEASTTIKYDHYFIRDLLTLKKILEQNEYDAIVVNGTKNTIPYANKKFLNQLKIPLIQYGGDTSQRLGNDFDRSNFDFWFVDDSNYVLANPYVLKVGKNYLPYDTDADNVEEQFDAASFGFALPNKGFSKVLDVAKQMGFQSTMFHLPKSDPMDPNGNIQSKIINDLIVKAKQLNLKITITTDLLSKEDLIKHLRKAKNLLFLYENNRGKREQISGVFEYAISTKKNIYISNCSMFRHVLYYEPKKLRVETLIINKNNTQKLNYETILDEWSTENFRWYFDQAINKVIKSYKIEGKPTTINIYKKKLRVLAKKILEKVGAYQPRTQNYYYDINNFSENFPKLNINNQEFNNCINADDIKLYKNEIDFFNKVCPELVAKKNYQALSQYAILLRLMQKTQKDILNIKILCVGAYEDVVATSLKRIGIYVEEVDPNLNYNLEDFIKKPSQKNMKYDLIYSISVLEHIFDDINILKICEQKLKKGGLQFHTVDFRDFDGPIPRTHYKVYNTNSINYLTKQIKNSAIFGKSDYTNAKHDFFYNDIHYNFASLTLERL
jgi:hypothetical protein